MSTTEEQVLVVARRAFQEALPFLGRREGDAVCHFQAANEERLDLLCDAATFTNRALAEEDVHFKQLIVYAMLVHEGRTLCYKRGKAGGEPRLHAKHSIGVGGHINPMDWSSAPGNGREKCLLALLRELEEEVGVTTKDVHRVNFAGFVNEDETPVGQVHLGLVYQVNLNSLEGLSFEAALVDPQWLTAEELLAHTELESWSEAARHAISVRRKDYQPYQQRVIDEKVELDVRLAKLTDFMDVPETRWRLEHLDWDLLRAQHAVMRDYSELLGKRIARF